ncbi:MAG: ABC transporter ATP-binding protein [Haloferacaceae archaeon]
MNTEDSRPLERGGPPGDGEGAIPDRDAAVRIENVTKAYGDVVAVDDVSLNVRDREFLSLLGPSGAGKTTLLHMIAGFVSPTRGDVYIEGEAVTDRPPYERNIGMVFQSMALFPHMTVEENISFPLEMRRFDPGRIDDRVREMLDLIRLPEVADRDVSELSGGQKQRVAMARALAFEPSLLLLDEPLSSLDKKLREEMRRELLRIHREADVTTVHVTHNQEEALTMADRVAVIHDGSIAQHSPTRELYARPNSAFVADFVGNTNLLRGVVDRSDGGTYEVALDGSDLAVECRPGERQPDPSLSEGEAATVAVRFERIRIGADLSTDNAFDATIEDVVFKGDLVDYVVRLAGYGDGVGTNVDHDGVDANADGDDVNANADGAGDGAGDDGAPGRIDVTVLNSADTRVFYRGEEVQVGWDDDDALLYPG